MIRHHQRHKERDQTLSLGRKLYEDITARLPAPVSAAAVTAAIRRLKLTDEDALLEAIALRKVSDAAVMEALMAGSAGGADTHVAPPQRHVISITGLTPGAAYDLAECCRPVPGDRIVGIRREGADIAVREIACPRIGDDSDEAWGDRVELAWGDKAKGGTARIEVTLKNEPGALDAIATVIGAHKANILGLRMDNRDTTFHTNMIELEVRNAAYLTRLLAALRAADAVSDAQRV